MGGKGKREFALKHFVMRIGERRSTYHGGGMIGPRCLSAYQEVAVRKQGSVANHKHTTLKTFVRAYSALVQLIPPHRSNELPSGSITGSVISSCVIGQ